MANITPRQYIARKTISYRAKYLKLFGRGSFYERPEHKIPGADHAIQVGAWLVSRPYGVDGETCRELLQWTDTHQLAFDIEAPSSWHPATVVVRVWNPEWAREFNRGADGYGDAFAEAVTHIAYHRMFSRSYHLRKPDRGYFKYREVGIYALAAEESEYGENIKSYLEPVEPYYFDRNTI